MANDKLKCPSCHTRTLEFCVLDNSELDICVHCRGIWCEATDWDEKTLGPSPGKSEVESLPENDRENNETESLEFFAPYKTDAPERTAIKCPRCQRPLASLLVKQVEGLTIDQCEACHGIWFDRREWQYMKALREWLTIRGDIYRKTTWKEWLFQLLSQMPVEYNIPPRRVPVVTIAIIAVCVLLQIFLSADAILENFAFQGIPSLQLDTLYTLISYQFVHLGILHLLGNVYLLYILGDNVEDAMGKWQFLLFFLACGIAAAFVQGIFDAGTGAELPVVGSSGSIAGITAAYLLLFRRARLTFMFIVVQFKPPAIVWIGVWLLIQVAAVVIDPQGELGVAWGAHIGGFVAGLLLVFPFRKLLVSRHPLLYLLNNRRLAKD